MPNVVDLSLIGDKQVAKALSKLAVKEQNKAMTKGLKAGGRLVQQRAIANAPQDTGKLKSGIEVRMRTRKGLKKAEVRTKSREFFGIPADSNFYYPAIIEYGSTDRGIKPFAYMRKARESEETRAIREVINALRRGLNL